MAVVKVTASGKKQVKMTIGAYNRVIHDGLINIITNSANRIHRGARNRAPEGLTGALRAGIVITPTRVRKASIVSRVSSTSPYASAVEFGGWMGKRPGGKAAGKQPPSRAFINYAEKRLGLEGKEAERAAYFVARNIAANGIRKKPYLGPSFVEERPRFYQNVYQLVASQGPALVTRRVKKTLVTDVVS